MENVPKENFYEEYKQWCLDSLYLDDVRNIKLKLNLGLDLQMSWRQSVLPSAGVLMLLTGIGTLITGIKKHVNKRVIAHECPHLYSIEDIIDSITEDAKELRTQVKAKIVEHENSQN